MRELRYYTLVRKKFIIVLITLTFLNFIAVKHCSNENIEILLNLGINVNAKDKSGVSGNFL